MKKLLIILTFLFSTLFFTDNVSASTTVTNYYKSGGSWSIVNFLYNNTDYELLLYKTATNDTNIHMGLLTNGTTYKFCTDNIFYGTHVLHCADVVGDFKYFYFNSPLTSGFSQVVVSDEPFNFTADGIPISNGDNFGSLVFTNNHNNTYATAGNYQYTDAFKAGIKNYYANSNYIYNVSKEVYITKNTNILSSPNVLISKDNETTVTIGDETFISSVTLNIEFSIIDNEKYLYMYKYGSNSDWATITLTQSNSFTRTFNYNDTLYVQVFNRETSEVVSSSTFSINSINYDFRPYVEVNETTPTACFFYKNGQNYTICKNLNIIAKNLEDGSYITSYSYDLNDWTNFENTNISINENKTIYFRIINYLTNEVSYTSTYTVSSIDTDISDLGVFNTYSSYYDKDTSFITAYINIYNLLEPVQDNYKIYYSTNSTSFTDITLLLNDMTNYYQYEINNINENKTIYFKITDLNDNILYTSTYSINYQIQANENTNFFTNFKTNFHGLSDIISTPLYAIKKLNKGVCTPLEIPIPHTNKTIFLPCMTTVYQNNIPEILNIWQIVTNGIISYYIILDLFRIVKSFKEPEEDKIEVVDL